MEKKLHETNAAPIATADQADTAAADRFAAMLRAYETSAHAAAAPGADTAAADRNAADLYTLAAACALSVLRKCIDPQRKTAETRETVSNSGISPALTAVRRDILADIAYLEKLTAAHNAAYGLKWTEDGIVSEVIDKDAEKAAAALQAETIGDGLDLVNAAVVAILEQTADHMTAAPGWMETAYTLRRINRRVLIRAEDTAAWEEVETTPIREVYRAIRREVQNSRAMQTDPRNGYSYIEDTAADPDSNATETIYRRLHKWADLGGHTMNGHYDPHGNARRGGQYTTTAAAVADYDATIAALHLTERQAVIVRLRMSGYGTEAIAKYLGVSGGTIRNTLSRLQKKCENIGFTWEMWHEMTAEK